MNKNKKINFLGAFLFLCYMILYAIIELKYYGFFSVDRFIIVILVGIFILLHFILDINKMYEYVFKKRYLIGCIILTFIVLMQYHGSSVGMYNRFLQPNNIPENSNPILGIARGIRSDEWMVSTLHMISQIYSNFSSNNSLIMGEVRNVLLYPLLPCFDIAMLGRIVYIPFLILPFSYAFSLFWFGKLFLMFFSAFELFRIITKNNRLYSLLGAVLIVFSGANMWWSIIDMIIWGNLATLILYYFINAKKRYIKVLMSILMGIVGLNYVLCMYPAWQVPFGYIYLGLFLYLIITNKKKLKYLDLIYIPLSITIIASVIYYAFKQNIEIFNLTTSTVYPGKRLVLGGTEYTLLYDYILNLFYSFKDIGNPSGFSNFIGLYPLPIFYSIYIIFKNKKDNIKTDLFLMIFTIILILLSIWNYVKLPKFVVKITLLSFSTPYRTQLVINFGCIFLITYILSKYQKSINLNFKKNIVMSAISVILFVFLICILNKIFEYYLSIKVIIITALIFIPLFFMFMLNNKKYNKYFAIILIVISLFIGGTANPISKGFSVILEKPVSKKIQEITKNNPDKLWMTLNSNLTVANYALANGTKIINSTNFYPNFELWKVLDNNNKYNDIYNRYAHVIFTITDNSTNFKLIQDDFFEVNININDVCLLKVEYAISSEELEKYNTEIIKFETLYNEDSITINKVNCN